jgi:nitrogen fixation protein FixH
MSAIEPRQGFRLTGWHVLGLLTLFFGTTLVVDGLMVVDAYKTYPGEVSSTPYEDGLAWDSELDQQKAQAALGWRMTAGLATPGVVEVTARDRTGAALDLQRIEARLERPATELGKRTIHFDRVAPGVYRASVGPLHGGWDLRLEAFDHRGRRFDAERRLAAP